MVTFKEGPAVWDDEVTALGQGDNALRYCSALWCSKVLNVVEPSHRCLLFFCCGYCCHQLTSFDIFPPEGFLKKQSLSGEEDKGAGDLAGLENWHRASWLVPEVSSWTTRTKTTMVENLTRVITASNRSEGKGLASDTHVTPAPSLYLPPPIDSSMIDIVSGAEKPKTGEFLTPKASCTPNAAEVRKGFMHCQGYPCSPLAAAM